MYKIEFSKKSDRFLQKIPWSDQERIANSLKRIQVRPHAYIKKLVASPYFRLRVGDYRLILDIRNGELIILVIEMGHRKNIYEKK